MAKSLVIDVYKLTREFPAAEKYGLVYQINRAAISIASNLAEGSGRTSRKDQAHFTQIAYGSLMEVACQLEIAQELGFMTRDELQAVSGSMKTVAEKLSALRSAQLKNAEEC